MHKASRCFLENGDFRRCFFKKRSKGRKRAKERRIEKREKPMVKLTK